MRARIAVLALMCAVCSCSENPNAPHDGPLADGQWAGTGACLTIADSCTMTSGCSHGVFPRPTVRDDGTFDVDGTYRVEIGPVSFEPAPSAHFSGSIVGSKMTLTVTPGGTLPKATYTMKPDAVTTCGIRCV
jgi:hypothetical protein